MLMNGKTQSVCDSHRSKFAKECNRTKGTHKQASPTCLQEKLPSGKNTLFSF